jgi:hypothetical protein
MFICNAQMRDDDAGDGCGEVRRSPGSECARKVRVVAVVVVAHVHAAVEHDALPADGHHHAALPHLLSRPCNHQR